MKNQLIRILALLLAISLLGTTVPQAQADGITHYKDMEYVRPDLQELRDALDTVRTRAEGRNALHIWQAVSEFFKAYDWFSTRCALASIRCSADLSDAYWSEENAWCLAAQPEAEQMLTELDIALAHSPAKGTLEILYFGRGYFDDVDADESNDELYALLDQEAELVSQYYSQSAEQSDGFLSLFFNNDDALVQTLVDLIRVRHRIAAAAGYDSYEAYANDYFYYRDYTPEQLTAYLDAIRVQLVPIYQQMGDLISSLPEASEEETFAYLRSASENMGGSFREAFSLLERAGLYDISYNPNKYHSSFELYLASYEEPFLFIDPELTAYDFLTISHEFGHFCNDYVSSGAQTSIDVMEILSQAAEYLALLYTDSPASLHLAKLADSLDTYVGQACYASFEQEMYRIPEELLSPESLCDLFETCLLAYGMEGYDRDGFVTIPHFYTNPMYVSSYIISNDAAMQIYAMELAAPGEGLACLEANLGAQEPYFLAFLEQAHLESPFAPGRLENAAAIFRETFIQEAA